MEGFFLKIHSIEKYVALAEALHYVHRNRRLIKDREPRTSTSTFTQLLSSDEKYVTGREYIPSAGVCARAFAPEDLIDRLGKWRDHRSVHCSTFLFLPVVAAVVGQHRAKPTRSVVIRYSIHNRTGWRSVTAREYSALR